MSSLLDILSLLLSTKYLIINQASYHLLCILFYQKYYLHQTFYQLPSMLLLTRYFIIYCVFYSTRYIILLSILLSNIYFILLGILSFNMYFISLTISLPIKHLITYCVYYSTRYVICIAYFINY